MAIEHLVRKFCVAAGVTAVCLGVICFSPKAISREEGLKDLKVYLAQNKLPKQFQYPGDTTSMEFQVMNTEVIDATANQKSGSKKEYTYTDAAFEQRICVYDLKTIIRPGIDDHLNFTEYRITKDSIWEDNPQKYEGGI